MYYRFIFIFTFLFGLSSIVHAKMGAGTLPLYEINQEGYAYFGKEKRFSQARQQVVDQWSGFGGEVEARDRGNRARTARRECYEETGGAINLSLPTIENSPFVDHDHHSGDSYREFYVDMRGSPLPKPQLNQNKNQEKIEYKFVKISTLLQSINSGSSLLPGTNDELWGPSLALLKKQQTQDILTRFMNAAKQPSAPQPPRSLYLTPQVRKPVLQLNRRPIFYSPISRPTRMVVQQQRNPVFFVRRPNIFQPNREPMPLIRRQTPQFNKRPVIQMRQHIRKKGS